MNIDPSALNSYRDFMGEEADAFIADIINSFTEGAPKLVDALEKALANNNRDEFVRAAHTLKSNSSTVGATLLAELSGELEAKGKEEDLQLLAKNVVDIKTELSEVVSHFSK